jgi:hypothetical protein
MENSPFWQAYSCSDNQEIPRLLRNPKNHYRVYKTAPLDIILSKMNPVHTLSLTSLWPILILSCHISLGLPIGLLTSVSPTKILCMYVCMLVSHVKGRT